MDGDRGSKFVWGANDLEIVPAEPVCHYEHLTWAADQYARHLRAAIDEHKLSPGGMVAAQALVSSIESVLASGEKVDLSEIKFTCAQMDQITEDDVKVLIDQWYFGVGNDGAQVIFMGTEEGYEANRRALALGCSGYSLMWLTGSRLDIYKQLADPDLTSPVTRYALSVAGTYHRHPYDYQQGWRKGRGTWRVLAELMALYRNEPVGLGYAEAAQGPRLGDVAYQLDRSGTPAKKSAKGDPPTSERQIFLVRLLGACQSTARVLVLHGNALRRDGGRWSEVNDALATAFLGVDTSLDEWPEVRVPEGGRRRYWRLSHGGRVVLRTWALNGQNASGAYIRALAAAMLPD